MDVLEFFIYDNVFDTSYNWVEWSFLQISIVHGQNQLILLNLEYILLFLMR